MLSINMYYEMLTATEKELFLKDMLKMKSTAILLQ